MKTQHAILLQALKQKKYTSLEAAIELGIFALSQRCGELRRSGVKVMSEWVTTSTGKSVKAYRIAR